MDSDREKAFGLVIAGGAALRFGAPKALALFCGESLMARTAARLLPYCREVAVNARPGAVADAAGMLGFEVVRDPPDAPDGPLAGVLAGLMWARDEGAEILVTLPCDTPLVPHDLVPRLIAAMTEASCAVARAPDGLHPLCAAWGIELIEPLTDALSRGHPAVRRYAEGLSCAYVDFAEADDFLNVNTPQDLAEAERRAGAAAP